MPFTSMRRASWTGVYLLEAKALLFSISLHKSHKPIPLKSTSHDISGLDSVWLSVYKLGLDIHGREVSFIVNHEQACDVPKLL